MFAAIRRYNIATGSAEAIVRKVNESYVPMVTQQPGFVSYFVLDPGDGTIVSISVFEDRASTDAATRASTEWVRANLGGVIRTAPVIVTGDVVARAGEGAAAR